MNYLAKAAQLIDKAASAAARASSNETQSKIELQCARTYAPLAAIDKGLLPQQLAEDIYHDFGGAK